MHYVPTSFLPRNPDFESRSSGNGEDSARFAFWPLYILASLVGLLLAMDQLISWINEPTWLGWQRPFGFRLALIGAVLGGARILYQTLDGFFEGKIGADLALTIATLSAIILGESVVAALVVLIALVGESLEGVVASTAHRTIRGLFELCPKTVHLYRSDQDLEVDIPLEEAVVGDLITVRPGERLAVDGVVVRGTTEIDQSTLTGESWPVPKKGGDQVYAGTLNQLGGILVQIEKTGSETTYGQIVSLVASALQKKSPIERQADRLALLFLPVVLGIASATLLFWRVRSGYWSAGWMPSLSVLVVACPCPLILATPSAVLAAMSWLAKRGVVIKGSEVLERLARVDTLALDKTGTVTRGELQVSSIIPLNNLSENELLRIAAAAERRSEHLLGRLLVGEAESRGLVLPIPTDTKVYPGRGIVSRFSTNSFGNAPASTDSSAVVLIGNASWLEEQSVTIPKSIHSELQRADEEAETPLLVALEGECIGVITVRDQLRAGASRVISELKEAGVGGAILLTGDRIGVTRRVAIELGLQDRFLAEQLPTDKAEWIDRQQRSGGRVLMVGDGINDAPALATASVGIAIGGVGSHIAAEAGDVILMGEPLDPLPGLVRISSAVVRNIRQSILIFAFGMNGLGMLLSALGILNPVGASLFHEGASLAVMLNALRLLWFESWSETAAGKLFGEILRTFDAIIDVCSPQRIVAYVVGNFTVLLKIAFSLSLVLWSVGNLTIVCEGEQALVTRFGKRTDLLQPGIHLRWPYPLEKIYRERISQVRVLQIGFRGDGDGDTQGVPSPPIEWQAEHRGANFQQITDESLMLGGEEVPLDMTSELHYRITDLSQFILSVKDPERILRTTLERVLRELVSIRRLEALLTDSRTDLERFTLEELRSQIRNLHLGVELLDVVLLDVHPPIPVIPDYRKVGDALEYREELINEGRKTYIRELMLAVGEPGLRIISGGIAHPGSQSLELDDEWQLTEPLWKSLHDSESPNASETETLAGTAADLLQTAMSAKTKLIEEARGEAESFQLLAEEHRRAPELTLTQILLEFREEFLSRIPITLLDPEAKGRRHWIFGNPLTPPALSPGLPDTGSLSEPDPLTPLDQLSPALPEPAP